MIISEIVKSCSHHEVAYAALVCIGEEFRKEVEKAAYDSGLTPGVFVATSVRRFQETAREADWKGLRKAVEHAEMPVLKGLRYILETTLRASLTR